MEMRSRARSRSTSCSKGSSCGDLARMRSCSPAPRSERSSSRNDCSTAPSVPRSASASVAEFVYSRSPRIGAASGATGSRIRSASIIEEGSGSDFQIEQSRARAATQEPLRILVLHGHRADLFRLAREPEHEFGHVLARRTPRIAELHDDIEPGAGVHGSVRQRHAMHAARFTLAEQLELRRLEKAQLDFREQRLDRIRLVLQLVKATLPERDVGMAGLDRVQRALQLQQPPDRDRIPVLRRRHLLQRIVRGLPLAAVVEEVAEIDARLVERRVLAQCASLLAQRAVLIAETVQRVAESGDHFRVLRMRAYGLLEYVACRLVQRLAVERAADRQHDLDVLAAHDVARVTEQVERLVVTTEAQQRFTQADHRVLVLRIEDQCPREGLTRPRVFL